MGTNEIKRFISGNGVPEITQVFWSYSDSPETAAQYKGCILPFYGVANEKNKRDLYCHFRVKDLFISNTSQTNGEIPKTTDERGYNRRIFQAMKDPASGKELPATQFIIDLFAFKTNDKKEMFTKNLNDNLKIIESRITDFADITVDIAPLGKVAFDNDYAGKYPSGEVAPDTVVEGNPFFTIQINGVGSLTRYTQLIIKRVLNSIDKPLWDICFKLDLNEEFEKKFIEQGDEQESLFAWAWVLNCSTWAQYKDIFNIDITSKKDRLAHLKKPQEHIVTRQSLAPIARIPGFLANTVRYLKKLETKIVNTYNESPFVKDGKAFEGTVLGKIGSSREEYTALYGGDAALPDPFLFDEPFQNFIAFRSELPVSNLFLGVDVAYPVGLCEADHKDLSWWQAYSYLNAENYGEHFAWMDRFLLKEGTADCWLKMIERDTVQNENFSKFCNKPVARKDFPFTTKEQVPFRCIDMMKADVTSENRDLIKNGLVFPVPVEKVDYLWIVEDENIDSCELKPDGTEEPTDAVKMLIYKGFACEDKTYRFTGVCHSKVRFRERDGHWQAHSVCHRPLYLLAGIDRDFSDEEMTRYNANPLTMHFQIRDMKSGKTYLFKKPLTSAHTFKQGIHLFVVYPQFTGKLYDGTPVYSVTVSAPDNVIPIQNNFVDNNKCSTIGGLAQKIFRVRNWERYLGFGTGSLKEHTSFSPVEHGFFKDNPLVLVDDVRPAEALADARKKALSEFYKDIELSIGSFVASYAFADSDVGDLYELLRKGEVGDKSATALESVKAIIASGKFGTAVLGNWIMRIGIKETVINRILIAGGLFDNLRAAAKTFDAKMKKIEHPFMDTVDFGTSPDHFDSLYMLAATQIKRVLYEKTGKYSVRHDKSKVLGVTLLNRFIDIGQGQPFNFQLDKNSGFVERSENHVNESDSVTMYRVDYQKKLEKIVNAIRQLRGASGNKMGKYYAMFMDGNGLEQIFAREESGLNPQFQFSAQQEKALLKKAFTEPKSLSEEQFATTIGILKFLQYADASFATCPKCGAIMKPSWGWCPYHGIKNDIEIDDYNSDGDLFDDFIKRYGPSSLQKIIDDGKIVHWTQFIV